MRRLLFCACLLWFVPLFAASPALTLRNERVASPAPVGARQPEFSTDQQKRLCLSWKLASAAEQVSGSAAFVTETVRWDAPAQPLVPVHQACRTGEVLIRSAGRQAKAWFTATPSATVLLSVSPDAGSHFLQALVVDDGHPCGAPDAVLLTDGTALVVWPERQANQDETTLWLRRVSPGGSLSVPVLLGNTRASAPSVTLGLLNDFGAANVRVLVAWESGEGEASQIEVHLLTLDPATDQPRKNPCSTCPDPDKEAAGYALRGIVKSISSNRQTVCLVHGDVPEVLAAGVTCFHVDATALGSATEGSELIGRVEKRGDDWWLFSPRLLLRPKK